jgi:predicted DCC family thiol-disulfide oxidoreductase YuxK
MQHESKIQPGDASASEKPILVYDGDCSFCRLWIERWRALTGERVRYAPFQEVAAQFPETPRDAFARAVQLIVPGGGTFSAAHAVFRTLALVPGLAWMLWLYQHLPGAAFVAESLYGFVARHRNPLYRLTRLFWGKHFEQPTFSLATWLFLRLLGVVYFFAFLSLATQILGLIGRNGILPAGDFLAIVRSRFGTERYWLFPTLAWLGSSDTALQVMSGSGVACGLLLIFDIAPMLVLSLLWVLYLSLVTVGGDFLSFQWDNLLLEAGFVAILLAPGHLWPRGPTRSAPPGIPRWLLWFLLFRLMFSSGAVKLASGDPTWRNLTALQYHYYTQPLPTPIAWYMHLAPAGFQRASTVFTLFIELVVPFLIFAPRLWRFVGGGLLILLQVLIALTGNYAFFNLLTVAQCVLLYDDAFLKRFFPRAVAERLRGQDSGPWRFPLRRWVTGFAGRHYFCGRRASACGPPLASRVSVLDVSPALPARTGAHRERVWSVRRHDHFAPGDYHSGQQRWRHLERLRIQIQARRSAPLPSLGGAVSTAAGLANVVCGAGGLS